MSWKMTKLIKYMLYLVASALLLTVALAFLYFRFGGDWGVSLPGGYSLSSVYPGAVQIFGPSPNKRLIVFANIQAYRVYENMGIVTGHVSNAGLPPPDSAASIPGYFILNTRNGTILKGLLEKTWLDSLKRYGIMKKPSLRKPTGFDKNYK